MKAWKIITIVGIIFLLIGVVSAANLVDTFKAPSPLEALGNSNYADGQGHNIMLLEYNDENTGMWFENDTDPVYLVEKYNDTCYIATDDENDCYIFEIVEKDGAKYIISSWTPKGPNEAQTLKTNLEEFNKLNQLTPLPIEE